MNGSHDRANGPRASDDSRHARAPAQGSSRAEKYEDEKRRIMESCFSKMDPNGALSESYITHLRVTEDAAYPQTPPPPSSPPQNKKPRVVIIAVRSSGRVRIHKGRENANGSFSIGKTWNLEDLSAIETFAHASPKSQEDAQRKEWAGAVGFVVTIAKPYYWQANSPKEKDFFINSLIKIYGKYTSGKAPQLIGFSSREADQVLRPAGPPSGRQPVSPGPPSARNPPSPARPPPSRSGASPGAPPLPGHEPRPLQPRSRPGTAGEDRPGQPRPPPSRGRDPMPTDRMPMPPDRDARRPRPSQEREMRKAPSREQMRGRPSYDRERSDRSDRSDRPSHDHARPLPPSLSTAHLTPKSSHSEFRPTSPNGSSTSRGRGPPPLMTNMASPGKPRPFPASPISRPEFPASPSIRGQDPSSPIIRDIPKSPIVRGQDFPSSPLVRAQDVPASPLVKPEVASIVTDVPPSPISRSEYPASPVSREDEGPGLAGSGLASSTMNRWGPNGANREPSPHSLRPSTATSTLSTEEKPIEAPVRKRPPMLAPQAKYDDLPAPLRSPRAPPKAGSPLPSPTPSPGLPPALSPRLPPVAVPEPTPAPPTPLEPEVKEPEVKREEPAPATPVEKPQEPFETPLATPPVAPVDATPPEKSPSQDDSPATSVSEEARPAAALMLMKKNNNQKKMGDILRRAANTYGAFKPRTGGAAERFKAANQEPTGEAAEGITAVFNAPSLARKNTDDSMIPETPVEMEGKPEEAEVPSLKVSEPVSAPTPAVEDVVAQAVAAEAGTLEVNQEAARSKSPDDIRRQRRRSNTQAKYLASLGLDPSVLDSRGLEIEAVFSDFGWARGGMQPKKLDAFEAELKREIARVEAGSWLSQQEHNDDRIDAVEKLLDKVIGECDELEGLLTLYNVELSSLNDDIAFIEAQSQGLQVQTANQKLLHGELKSLVDTISIDTRHLEPLKRAQIGKIEGLEAIESSLLLLYKAMITIDPSLRQGVHSSLIDGAGGMGSTELGNMRALQEKKESYLQESATFLARLKQHMDMTFGAAMLAARDAMNRAGSDTKLDPALHDVARNALWQYSPLLLFAKEIDLYTWDALLKMYQGRARHLYQDEFRDNAIAWKRMARSSTGEEQELLFTSQEKDTESLSVHGAARKLTVKRSQGLAGKFKSAADKATKLQGGTLYHYESFAGALDEMTPLVFTEQNFVVEFFHASSIENMDFADAVTSARPQSRRGGNLFARKMFEPDRALAKRVAEVMDDIFAFWPQELQNLVEWVVRNDPLQGIGILCALDRKLIELEETNQDFLTRTLQALHTRLTGLFNRFVDTQISAIEDTKVKIKKRKGVIAFIKTFPHFSAAIENMLPAYDDPERLEVRTMVDDAYQKINKAMFESLKVIAKESPAAVAAQAPGVSGAGADPEDKEALNYHILHIENMNHYMEEVEPRGDIVLGDWRDRAQAEMNEHMALYVDAVIRRPLGKLLDFLSPIPQIIAALPAGTPPSAISSRPSHSRSLFKKITASNDTKEIRRGIEALRKRVDKHFGDADDPSLSRGLVTKVLAECERKYQDVWQMLIRVNNDVYAGEVDVGSWGDEVAGAFRR
ncbi:uncharacterized protein K452DRAFT_278230 [Aplosporella prunicola CBS 121167]|uniref:Exocyst complex component Sec3 PIP2-binding N-terminal domain-containing protein n=1 Tax=Aplosporella prunicola CBS 121167 TaxID=1176127 RepID=A0A6A6B2Z2_9PEZI|nr:uncharacterized protein K452DRAFT_278230 [Aplosporella prunicola CBS 121167]KAF2137594.1 hypothetical protein K452DRAFT_278230 [Aplosporella prunicola CBS 121167]